MCQPTLQSLLQLVTISANNRKTMELHRSQQTRNPCRPQASQPSGTPSGIPTPASSSQVDSKSHDDDQETVAY